MANDNPAKLGRRHSYNLRLPQADAYPLLAGRRAEGDNPISAPRCPPSSYAKDSEVWTDQFGDAAMINGVPFDTTKHLAKIDVEDPESLAVGAVVGELVTKQPKEFFATLYKDSFNGTPIAPEPTKQTFPGFGSLEASFSVDKGKMQGEATFTLSPEIVAKLGENFFAEGATEQPKLKISTSADLTHEGNIENIRIMFEAKDIPAISIDKVSGKAELMAEVEKALTANPRIENNQFVQLVKRGLEDVADAWPAYGIRDLMDGDRAGIVAIPMQRDSKLQLSLRIGEKDDPSGESSMDLEVKDLLAEDDKIAEVGLVGKVVPGADDDQLVVKDIAVGNSGLLALRWKDGGGAEPKVYRTNPETGKQRSMNGHEAGDVLELVTMIPGGLMFLAGNGGF